MTRFNEIILFQFIIYSFAKLKVLVNLPKSFHGPFDYGNALELAIHHSSIG